MCMCSLQNQSPLRSGILSKTLLLDCYLHTCTYFQGPPDPPTDVKFNFLLLLAATETADHFSIPETPAAFYFGDFVFFSGFSAQP